ncbi:AAA family ATPase [Flavobacterium sp. NRK F7]|uniref:AAA family ATPase n=1 Tax=Flavobacterium sp. NRK F7 TaxID=2954930 RepID=UPI0035ADFC39
MSMWIQILSQIVDEELLRQFIIEDNDGNYNNLYKVDIPKFHETKDKMSSGQNILLFIITEIVANIRYDSLILYDEPETHLHPNAISELINTIYQLVDKFQSFCIIGTHSPLIIQELLSKNVFIMERRENLPSIRKIEIESFGENLSKLTEDVFGNRDVSKMYKEIIKELVSHDKSFEEIVKILTTDDTPLSLNAKLYIASQIERNEKS